MFLAAPTELNRLITVEAAGFNLAHRTRTQLNHRDCAHAAGGVNHLGHPDLLADQSAQHSFHQSSALLLLQLDLDIHAGREVKLAQGVDSLLGWFEHVEQTLVCSDLEVFS
jgi:hypothetical protein